MGDTTAPRVLNKSAGGRDGVYIGRPSKWGNPFVIPLDGTREEVIRKYAAWLGDGCGPSEAEIAAREEPDLLVCSVALPRGCVAGDCEPSR